MIFGMELTLCQHALQRASHVGFPGLIRRALDTRQEGLPSEAGGTAAVRRRRERGPLGSSVGLSPSAPSAAGARWRRQQVRHASLSELDALDQRQGGVRGVVEDMIYHHILLLIPTSCATGTIGASRRRGSSRLAHRWGTPTCARPTRCRQR